MQSIKTLIGTPKAKNKYVSKEFQDYGLFLANKLSDIKYLSMYIKLAKNTPRGLLEQALSFAIDYPNAKNKGKIFLWKLTNLKNQNKPLEQKNQ